MSKLRKSMMLFFFSLLTVWNLFVSVSAEEIAILDFAYEGEVLDTYHIAMEQKPSKEELIEALPKQLMVYFSEHAEAAALDVSWTDVTGDYDSSNAWYYQFSPVWDMEQYPLDDALEPSTDVPYIAVFFYKGEGGLAETAATGYTNETAVYNFLKDNFNFNTATICGILANIQKESAFDPATYNGNDTGGTVSYGICQWNNGVASGNRYGKLQDWCAQNGYNHTTLEGQLNFMKYELKTYPYYRLSTLENDIPNTAEGAYEASMLWSKYYEGCAQRYYEERANLAKNTYWSAYKHAGTDVISIDDENYPEAIRQGDYFNIKGIISSGSALNNVTVSVYDHSGNMRTGKSVSPGTTVYDLKQLDNYVSFGKLEQGSYSYRVTASNAGNTVILIEKEFKIVESIVLPFTDIVRSDWFYDAVYYNYVEGLMTGKEKTIFAPNESLKRAQFASILYRINGAPKVEYQEIFPDVTKDAWYAEAVTWAYKSGIIKGYNNGQFGPNDSVTREQIAIMMYNYAKAQGHDTTAKGDLDKFADKTAVSGYAEESVQWAVGSGIISGMDNGKTLNPLGETARAQCAAIIQKFTLL